MKFISTNHKRLDQLKRLLADELKSSQPGLLYIEDLKLSIVREIGKTLDNDNRVDNYEIIEVAIPSS